jgi:hypothetical protein
MKKISWEFKLEVYLFFENFISKPPFDLTYTSYTSSFVSGITEILLFEQTGQQLMIIVFFCVDLMMVALQKHISQSRNWRSETYELSI